MMISRLEDPPVFFDRARAHYRGRSAEERVTGRQAQSKALVDGLKIWLEGELVRVSGKSVIAAAIRYGLKHRDGLVRFLADGRQRGEGRAILSGSVDPH